MKTGLLHKGQQALTEHLKVESQVSVEGVVSCRHPLLEVPEAITGLLLSSGKSITGGTIHSAAVQRDQARRPGCRSNSETFRPDQAACPPMAATSAAKSIF